MERARHIHSDVVPAVWRRQSHIACRDRLMHCSEVAEAGASPMDDDAPALDTPQLGRHLDARKALDVFERDTSHPTSPRHTQLPGGWIEIGRQPLTAVHSRLTRARAREHRREPRVAEIAFREGLIEFERVPAGARGVAKRGSWEAPP